LESCNVYLGFSHKIPTISRVPKYSVVPGSILILFIFVRPDFEDSIEVLLVLESIVQLGWISHKETEFVVFTFSESLLRFPEFFVVDHKF
jgi:hypothetical protein